MSANDYTTASNLPLARITEKNARTLASQFIKQHMPARLRVAALAAIARAA